MKNNIIYACGHDDCSLPGDYTCDYCSPNQFINSLTNDDKCCHCCSTPVIFHCVECGCKLCLGATVFALDEELRLKVREILVDYRQEENAEDYRKGPKIRDKYAEMLIALFTQNN